MSSHMDGGDFRANEQSVTVAADDDLRIEHVGDDGTVTVLKESIPVLAGEVVDATVMSARGARRVPRRADRRSARSRACCSRCT